MQLTQWLPRKWVRTLSSRLWWYRAASAGPPPSLDPSRPMLPWTSTFTPSTPHSAEHTAVVQAGIAVENNGLACHERAAPCETLTMPDRHSLTHKAALRVCAMRC